MKKILAVLLVSLFLLGNLCAYADNYSSMTDEELKQAYNSIRNEIILRGLIAENNTVVLDKNGVKIYINGTPSIKDGWSGKSLIIPIIIVNGSSKSINVFTDDESVNGWTADCSISNSQVAAGKKAKAEFQFDLDATDLTAIKDLEEVEFTMYVYDNDNWFGTKVVDKTNPITLYFK